MGQMCDVAEKAVDPEVRASLLDSISKSEGQIRAQVHSLGDDALLALALLVGAFDGGTVDSLLTIALDEVSVRRGRELADALQDALTYMEVRP